MTGSPPPTKIMIIRHAEKPPKPPNNAGPWDVLVTGQTGGGNSLIVPGWQRAGALNAFFAPYQSMPSNPKIATPNYIYAADPKGETQRPWETVTPLAAWLNYPQDTPQFNISYSVGGGEPDLVTSVLALSGVVLICWEHHNIMPNILGAVFALGTSSHRTDANARCLTPRNLLDLHASTTTRLVLPLPYPSSRGHHP